jgi:hypothetical protein
LRKLGAWECEAGSVQAIYRAAQISKVRRGIAESAGAHRNIAPLFAAPELRATTWAGASSSEPAAGE